MPTPERIAEIDAQLEALGFQPSPRQMSAPTSRTAEIDAQLAAIVEGLKAGETDRSRSFRPQVEAFASQAPQMDPNTRALLGGELRSQSGYNSQVDKNIGRIEDARYADPSAVAAQGRAFADSMGPTASVIASGLDNIAGTIVRPFSEHYADQFHRRASRNDAYSEELLDRDSGLPWMAKMGRSAAGSLGQLAAVAPLGPAALYSMGAIARSQSLTDFRDQDVSEFAAQAGAASIGVAEAAFEKLTLGTGKGALANVLKIFGRAGKETPDQLKRIAADAMQPLWKRVGRDAKVEIPSELATNLSQTVIGALTTGDTSELTPRALAKSMLETAVQAGLVTGASRGAVMASGAEDSEVARAAGAMQEVIVDRYAKGDKATIEKVNAFVNSGGSRSDVANLFGIDRKAVPQIFRSAKARAEFLDELRQTVTPEAGSGRNWYEEANDRSLKQERPEYVPSEYDQDAQGPGFSTPQGQAEAEQFQQDVAEGQRGFTPVTRQQQAVGNQQAVADARAQSRARYEQDVAEGQRGFTPVTRQQQLEANRQKRADFAEGTEESRFNRELDASREAMESEFRDVAGQGIDAFGAVRGMPAGQEAQSMMASEVEQQTSKRLYAMAEKRAADAKERAEARLTALAVAPLEQGEKDQAQQNILKAYESEMTAIRGSVEKMRMVERGGKAVQRNIKMAFPKRKEGARQPPAKRFPPAPAVRQAPPAAPTREPAPVMAAPEPAPQAQALPPAAPAVPEKPKARPIRKPAAEAEPFLNPEATPFDDVPDPADIVAYEEDAPEATEPDAVDREDPADAAQRIARNKATKERLDAEEAAEKAESRRNARRAQREAELADDNEDGPTAEGLAESEAEDAADAEDEQQAQDDAEDAEAPAEKGQSEKVSKAVERMTKISDESGTREAGRNKAMRWFSNNANSFTRKERADIIDEFNANYGSDYAVSDEELSAQGQTGDFLRKLFELVPSLSKGLTVVQGEIAASGGAYDSGRRIATLLKSSSPANAVHEIFHHAERMLDVGTRTAIVKEWRNSLDSAISAAKERGNTERVAALRMLETVIKDRSISKLSVRENIMELMARGVLRRSDYGLASASEFFADNAARIMSGRIGGKGVGAKVKDLIRSIVEAAKSALGMRSDAPVLRALRRLGQGNGDFMTDEMLRQSEKLILGGEVGYGTVSKEVDDFTDLTKKDQPWAGKEVSRDGNIVKAGEYVPALVRRRNNLRALVGCLSR